MIILITAYINAAVSPEFKKELETKLCLRGRSQSDVEKPAKQSKPRASSSASSSSSEILSPRKTSSPKSVKISAESKQIQEAMSMISSYQKEYLERDLKDNETALAGILSKLLNQYWFDGSPVDTHWFFRFITKNTEFRLGRDLNVFLDKTPKELLSYVKMIINLPLDSVGTTLLMEASRDPNNMDLIKHLLLLGADPNSKDQFSYTPLHYLAKSRERVNSKEINKPEYLLALITLLKNYGADLNSKDISDKTPLEAAEKLENKDLVSALKSV